MEHDPTKLLKSHAIPATAAGHNSVLDPLTELQMLRSASKASRTGAWRWYLREDRIIWSDVTHALFEVQPGTQIDLEMGLSFYDEESLTRLVPAVDACRNEGTPWDLVARCKTTSGHMFWARSIGLAMRDAAGNIVALEGSFQDISAERAAMQARDQAEQDLQFVLKTMPDGFFLLDEKWRFSFINDASEKMLRRRPTDLIGKNIWDEFPEAVGSTFDKEYHSVEKTRQSRTFIEYFPPLDIWFEVTAHPATSGIAVHFRDVSDRVRERQQLELSQKELSRYADEVQEALAQQARFLADVSHEIRTPLNGILGMAQLVEKTRLDREQSDMIATIKSSGDTLVAILNDILDLSKIEAGRLELANEPFDASATICKVVDLYQPKAKDKKIFLTIEGADSGAFNRTGDHFRIEQIIGNLISNAIKFTDRGGVSVRVDLTARDTMSVEVADTGAGITDTGLSKIFSRFEQGDARLVRAFGGTGLGLAISHKLAELMGGRITVKSTLGLGSSFRLDVPLPIVSIPQSMGDTTYPAGLSTEPQDVERQPLKGIDVLVAEDNPTNQMIISAMLSSLGASVRMVSDGDEIIPALEAGWPDVFLLDVLMPRLDGQATLQALINLAKEKGIRLPPAIAVTASVMKHEREQYATAGFAACVPKPILILDLQNSILQVLAARC